MAIVWTPWSVAVLVLFFIIMNGFGCTLEIEKFKNHLSKPKGIIIGFLSQYLLMPFLCWSISEISGMKEHLQFAMILLGCSPGGAVSNFYCYIFRMDVELSVAMTTCSSIASIAMMPLNTFIYITIVDSFNFKFDWFGLILSCICIVCGTLCGIYINIKHYEYTLIFEKFAGIGAIIMILGNAINNTQSDAALWEYPSYIYLCLISVIIMGYLFGFTASRLLKLDKSSCIAVAAETGMQNTVISIAIITLTFKDKDLRDESVGIPLVYTVFTFLWGITFFGTFFKLGWTDADDDVNICQAFKEYRQIRVNKVKQVKEAKLNKQKSKINDDGETIDGAEPNPTLRVVSTSDQVRSDDQIVL